MCEVIVADAAHADFVTLIKQLDNEYYERYGDAVLAYRPYNDISDLDCVVLAYANGKAVACGGFWQYDRHTVEIKRIFVQKPYRRRGIALKIIKSLEQEAFARGYEHAVLETGVDMVSAQALYKKLGYRFIENYGVYAGDESSVCMDKTLPGYGS